MKKPRGRPFEKGNKKSKGKKKGFPQYDAEELATKKVDHGMVSRYCSLNFHLTRRQLEKKLRKGGLSMLEDLVIRSLTGNTEGLSYNPVTLPIQEILNRMIGKVPDIISLAVKNKYSHMTTYQLLQEKRRLESANRETVERLEEEAKQRERLQLESTSTTNLPIDVESKEIS